MATTMPRPHFPCQGGCACGEVRYQLLEDPLELHVCHCTDCQRLSGSAFVMSMPVRRSALELVQGEPVLVEFRNPEGVRKRDLRCPVCSSRLWSEPPRYPQLFTLRAGTLDDTSWLSPIAHIWTASAQPWVSIPEPSTEAEASAADAAGGPGVMLVYPREPDDALKLVRAWKGRFTSAPS